MSTRIDDYNKLFKMDSVGFNSIRTHYMDVPLAVFGFETSFLRAYLPTDSWPFLKWESPHSLPVWASVTFHPLLNVDR